MVIVAQSALLSLQRTFSPTIRRLAAAATARARRWTPLSSKHLTFGQCVRQRQERTRRKGPVCLSVRAISSTGTLVGGESLEDGGDGVSENSTELRKKVVEEKKKLLIAGVDQTQLFEPHLLADPDSRFAEYYGVQIHHKIARPTNAVVSDVSSAISESKDEAGELQKVDIPAILLHGFGASLFSWEMVMSKLSEMLGAPVMAFDRPAFGLTSRTFPPPEESEQKFKNAYTVAFSAAATVAFIDFLKSDQAILIAHSAGCLVAIDAYFQSPEKVAALILIAPALVGPLLQQIASSKKETKKESSVEGELKQGRFSSFSKVLAPLLSIWLKLLSFLRMVTKFVRFVFSKILRALFLSPPAVWLVRRIMDKGGPWAVRYAFFDVTKADQKVLDGYTRPLQCRDWERALLEYCLALVDNTEEDAPGKKKLQDVECPVLLVSGDTDRIVPDWNSENLVKVFPHAEFKRIKNCGHLPHEETPDEFLNTINDWLLRMHIKKANSRELAIT